MQPGDHCPRRRGGIFNGLNQQQARLNCHSEQGLGGYESSLEGSSYGGDDNFILDGLPDGQDPKGASSVASSCLLSLWSLQGAVTANELGQYRLEVSLALTQGEGDQMLSELAGRDRAESPEVFWDGSTDIGLEYDDNLEV